MKRIIICLFSCLLFISLKAQKSAVHLASPKQLTKRDHFGPKLKQLQKSHELSVRAHKVSPQSQDFGGVSPTAPSVISPVALGRLSNAYSVIRPEQNQVYANDSLGLVAWIHRQDVTIHGGGATQSGKFRYDISIDDGLSFNTDIGPLQTTFTHQGGYPNITGFGNDKTNPLDSELIWCGATSSVPDTGWLGHVYGLMDFFDTNPIISTEEYLFDSISTSFPGGLCRGLPGEYWTTDFDEDKDTIWLTKIIVDQNTGKLITTSYLAFKPNHNLTLGGAYLGPNLSFSPDGMTGYVVWLGDLVGGHDSVLSPCYYKTTDGGISWDSAATEIDLRAVPWLKDSLTSFWIKIDSLTGDTTPAGSGNPTTGFDYDVTVDYNGDLHIGTVIGNSDLTAGPPYYSITSGLSKVMADIYTDDGGLTWNATYLAPILTFRGEFGTADANGDFLIMDNFVQVSRTQDGYRVYFSWVDSDTSVIGFGKSENIAPNLRITGKRLWDDYVSCWRMITDGDPVWDGKILFPSMAPTVHVAASGMRAYLPIVWLEMLSNDQQAPCQGHFVGADAFILESDFRDPVTVNLSFNGFCYTVVGQNEEFSPLSDALYPVYPNPASQNVTIEFELEKTKLINLTIRNLYGQTLKTVSEGLFESGKHKVRVNTSDLSQGVYLYSLHAGDKVYTKKLVILK